MRGNGLPAIFACWACAAGLLAAGAAAEDKPSGSFKPLTSQSSITGSSGFLLPMKPPPSQESEQGTTAPQGPGTLQPAQDEQALPSSLTPGASMEELSQDQRAPELQDAKARQLPSMKGPGRAKPSDEDPDKVHPNANLDKKEITLAERGPMDHGRTEVGTRDTARDTAERFKKDVDASKTHNLGDKFYDTPMKGLWDEADKLYNKAVGWIKG